MKLSLIWLAINLSISQYKKDNMAGRDLSLISTIHAGNLLCEWKLKYWVNIRLKETISKISSNFYKKFRGKKTFSTDKIFEVFWCHLKWSMPNKIDLRLNKRVGGHGRKGEKSRERLTKTKEHCTSGACTFPAVPNSVQPTLKDRPHNNQSSFSIYFLSFSMLTLMDFSQPYKKKVFNLAKKKKSNPQVTNIKERRK